MTINKTNAPKLATPKTPATTPMRKAGIDAAKAAPKGGKIAAMAKAHATTPVRKAPAAKSAPSNESAFMDALRGLNARVEALETQSALNESRMADAFDKMATAIASLQLTLANMAPVTHTREASAPASKAPAAKTRKEAPANTERGTYDGPDVSGPVDAVLAYLADCVLDNHAAGFINENVAKASPDSMRRYLRTAQNKAFKACREAHDLTLTQLDSRFSALFA